MLYRKNIKNGDMISQLGFGCMRFPDDENEIEQMVSYAIENGVNFFDTAHVYKNSEEKLGRVLSNGKREKVKISTKLPLLKIKKYEDIENIFEEQLSRLKTSYIDYYFMHMLTGVDVWSRLIDIGILEWIKKKKESKQILNIGFSYHGGKHNFEKLIDIFNWDFCMIQYNFLDEYKQAGRSGLEYASSKGIPVMIMGPLRGGKLVDSLPAEVFDIWNEARIKRTPAEWSFRWIWNHKEPMLLFSGMDSLEVVKENIRIASVSKTGSLSDEELELFSKVRKVMEEKIEIPCTACNYCIPCPEKVDIPTCLSCYNEKVIYTEKESVLKYDIQTRGHRASLCIDCGVCIERCPQGIDIPKELERVKIELENKIKSA